MTETKVIRRKEIIKIRVKINELENRKTIEKISKTKRWLVEKINKFDKTLARLVKEKREFIQINKIIGEKGDVTIDTTKIQRIAKGYHEQLYTYKLDHQKQMENS